MSLSKIQLYEEAKERYADFGVDTDKVLKILNNISLSIHCWQGDDVSGFERKDSALSSGGILSTGNHPGKAKNIDELRSDIDMSFSLIPGPKKLSLHAIYGDFKNIFIDRDKIETKHFDYWIDWAKQNNLGLDFNPTFFSHPLTADGYSLSSTNNSIRSFWIEHLCRSRKISDYIGASLNKKCINNIWIADGSKDLTINRYLHRNILRESLDEAFKINYSEQNMIDSLESKLFGIGSESYVVGSHDFYLFIRTSFWIPQI